MLTYIFYRVIINFGQKLIRMQAEKTYKQNISILPKRIAFLGILISAALLAFMLENLLPPLFLPGAKLGLSNIFTLLAIILLSPLEALILLFVRTVLGCLITGNPFAIVYSLSAGLISLAIGLILIRLLPKISVVAISVACAVAHNIVQNLVFCIINDTMSLISYMPYLALIGILGGTVTGMAVYFIIHKIPLGIFCKYISANKRCKEDRFENS